MRFALVVILSLAMIGAAGAQVWIMSPSGGGRASGSGAPPPVCSNSLDFTASCNSQYITVI